LEPTGRRVRSGSEPRPLTDAQARALAQDRRLAGTAPLDVIDIGCGTGFLSLLACGLLRL
jgi:ribosomal protein L11 methylase PrmA